MAAEARRARYSETPHFLQVKHGCTRRMSRDPQLDYRHTRPREIRNAASGSAGRRPPLRRLLKLLKALQVVLLLGKDAERSWTFLHRSRPDATSSLHVLSTRHTGKQAFIGTADERERWQEEQALAFAADLLRPAAGRHRTPRTGPTVH